MTRESGTIIQAHKACLDGANTITSVIATHNNGSDAVDGDYGYYMTTDEKKERVARSVGYLKYQKENYDDWGELDLTVIDKAIADADTFTGA